MNGNSFCMLLAGFFVISLFALFTAFGTSWGLVDVQYAGMPSPSWILVGGLTPTSVTIKVKLPAADAFVLLVSSDQELLIDPARYISGRQEVHFDARGASPLELQYEIQTVQVQNLQPNTQYYYKVREDAGDGSAILDDKLEGQFHTPAPTGYRFNYTVATAGCAWTGSTAEVFYQIEKTNPLMFLHLGDLHYEDISKNDMKARINAIGKVMASNPQADLYRSTSLAYMWDDHDFLGNDSDGVEEEEGALNTALQSYQLAFPHYPLPAMATASTQAPAPPTVTNTSSSSSSNNNNNNNQNATVPVPVYQAFTIGTVRFIISDLRSEANSQHIYSQTQAQWLKDELALAGSYDFVIWVTTKPWIGQHDPEDDAWYGGNYIHDREELSDYISNTIGAERGPQNLLAISADAHMVAFDDGSNTYYGTNPRPGSITRSFPILHSGSMDRVGKTKGDTFTDGCYGYDLQRTHQFSTLRFEFTTNESHLVDRCIQIDSYRNIEYSSLERELLLSKRLCNKIFVPTITNGEKEGTCEIEQLWDVNYAVLVAATIIALVSMIMSCVALKCSDATNMGDWCCKSCLVCTMVIVSYVLTMVVGFGTFLARGVQQYDVTPIAIILLCQTFCWFFYLGTWWACCTTSYKLRTRPRDDNDPTFLDVEPNWHIQDINLDTITTREEDDDDHDNDLYNNHVDDELASDDGLDAYTTTTTPPTPAATPSPSPPLLTLEMPKKKSVPVDGRQFS